MNQADKQTEFLRITIEHEYFSGLVPVDLFPEDPFIEKKYGIRIRRSGNCWIFYGYEVKKEDFRVEYQHLNFKFNSIVEKPAEKRSRIKDEIIEKQQPEPVVLSLIVKPLTVLFHYVTASVKNHSGVSNDLFDKKGIMTAVENTTLRFSAALKYLEYIFFTKHNQLNLKLMDTSGLVDFHQIPISNFDDGTSQEKQNRIQFISKEQISLSSRYNYQIRLIEETKYGERIILNAVNIPDPTSISRDKPYQAITAYYTV